MHISALKFFHFLSIKKLNKFFNLYVQEFSIFKLYFLIYALIFFFFFNQGLGDFF